MGGGVKGVHIHPATPHLGTIEDAPVGRIAEAEAWLRSKGCTRARGPMGPTTWHPYRAVVNSNGRAPFFGEPTFSEEPWRQRGFEPIAHYASSVSDNAEQAEAAEARNCPLPSAGWTVQGLEGHGNFEAALDCFHRISSAAFTEAFAYTPLPLDHFKAMYRPIESVIDPRLVLTAFTPTGKAAGFCFAMPDRLNPDSREFIIKTLAVDPAHHQLGIGSWLTGVVHRTAHRLGHTGGGIHALMWTGSHSNAISRHAATSFRRYALFEKAL